MENLMYVANFRYPDESLPRPIPEVAAAICCICGTTSANQVENLYHASGHYYGGLEGNVNHPLRCKWVPCCFLARTKREKKAHRRGHKEFNLLNNDRSVDQLYKLLRRVQPLPLPPTPPPPPPPSPPLVPLPPDSPPGASPSPGAETSPGASPSPMGLQPQSSILHTHPSVPVLPRSDSPEIPSPALSPKKAQSGSQLPLKKRFRDFGAAFVPVTKAAALETRSTVSWVSTSAITTVANATPPSPGPAMTGNTGNANGGTVAGFRWWNDFKRPRR